MAQVTVYLRGSIKWAKLQEPDKKFNVYTLDFYPDEASWDLYRQTDLELKEREDDDGGKFVKVRRPVEKLIKGELVKFDPPALLLKVGEDTEKLAKPVGNGSKGVIKLVVYDTPKGKGHRLESVMVEELVEYVPGEVLGDEEYPF